MCGYRESEAFLKRYRDYSVFRNPYSAGILSTDACHWAMTVLWPNTINMETAIPKGWYFCIDSTPRIMLTKLHKQENENPPQCQTPNWTSMPGKVVNPRRQTLLGQPKLGQPKPDIALQVICNYWCSFDTVKFNGHSSHTFTITIAW